MEKENTIYRAHIRILFPYSVLTTGKCRSIFAMDCSGFRGYGVVLDHLQEAFNLDVSKLHKTYMNTAALSRVTFSKPTIAKSSFHFLSSRPFPFGP